MKIWLDDERDPMDFGKYDWLWVKRVDDVIDLLKTGKVTILSLDHDLGEPVVDGKEKTGYTVVCWMEEHNVWPQKIRIHSMNPVGRQKMFDVCKYHCNTYYDNLR